MIINTGQRAPHRRMTVDIFEVLGNLYFSLVGQLFR